MTSGPVETQLPGLCLYQPPIMTSTDQRPESLQSCHEGNFLGNFVEKFVLVVPQPPTGLGPLCRDPLTVSLRGGSNTNKWITFYKIIKNCPSLNEKFHYLLLNPSLTDVLDSGCRQEVESVSLHVIQLRLGEDVVVEEQDGLLADNLQSAIREIYLADWSTADPRTGSRSCYAIMSLCIRAHNRIFPCIEATYPSSEEQEKPPMHFVQKNHWVFGCPSWIFMAL